MASQNPFEGIQLEPETLREQVSKVVRRAIIEGRIEPGDRLVEKEIAQWLRVSRGPVREALRDLEEEGLIIQQEARGRVVAKPSSYHELLEILDLAILLQGLAAKFAAEWATPRDISSLQEILDSMTLAAKMHEIEAMGDQDLLFHETICRIGRVPRVLRLLNAVRWQWRMVFVKLVPRLRPNLEDEIEVHQNYLDPLRAGEGNDALDFALQHLKELNERIVELGTRYSVQDGGGSGLQPPAVDKDSRTASSASQQDCERRA